MRPESPSRPGSWFLLLGLLTFGCQPDEPDASIKARVMPKNGEVWGRDLANGLGLQEWELCAELGSQDCIQDTHLITLGGVDPARLGIDEPLPSASVSAPIAADRVATAACGERLTRDEAGPAVIFGPVLEKNTAARRKQVAETLVQRLLGREATKEEIRNLADLYDTLEPIASDPRRDWAVGACVVVATSTEALFY